MTNYKSNNSVLNNYTPVFILGMPRSGTTWISKCFNEHPETIACGESAFFGKNYIFPKPDGLYHFQQIDLIRDNLLSMGNAFLGNKAGCYKYIKTKKHLYQTCNAVLEQVKFPIHPAELFAFLSLKIAETEGKKNAIEKTPHHINYIHRINQLFSENCKFIILIRNPYDFMASSKNQGKQYNEKARKNFKKLYHPLINSFIYRSYALSVIEALNKYPESTLLIRNENMQASPEANLKEAQLFSNLNYYYGLSQVIPLNTNSSFSSSATKNSPLNDEDIFWMNLVAGNAIKKLNYHLEESKPSIMKITKSSINLPAKALMGFKTINKQANSPLRHILSWLK